MPPSSHADTFHDRAAAHGVALAAALAETLAALPPPADGSAGPSELAKALRLNNPFTSRLLRSLRQSDPIAVLFHSPGIDPLRTFLGAARAHDAPASVVDAALAHVEALGRFIRDEAGDRSAFNAMLTAWLPDERRSFEVRRKQAMFKAMSELQGMVVHARLATAVLAPSADDSARLDMIGLIGLAGVSRLRADAEIAVTTSRFRAHDAERQPLALDGTPIRPGSDDALQRGVCVPTDIDVSCAERDGVMTYRVEDSFVGPHERATIVLAERNRAEVERFAQPERRYGAFGVSLTQPTRMLQIDLFLHDSIAPDELPIVRTYDLNENGPAQLNAAPDAQRASIVHDVVTPLAGPPSRARSPHLPSYTALLADALGAAGWNDAEFTGYRCTVDYPIFGTRVILGFERPTRA